MFTFIVRLLVVVTLTLLPCTALANTWQLDPVHTSVGFKVRHLMVSHVKGVFSDVRGEVIVNDAKPEQASVNVVIDAASIDTNNQKRDDHLRSPDFLNVAEYPTLTFVSKDVAMEDGQLVKVVGDLTIRGVTREVTLYVEEFTPAILDPWGHTRRGATASTIINRQDFGLAWNKLLEAGGVAVGDEVKISLEVEMTR